MPVMHSWAAEESVMVVKNRLIGFMIWQSIPSTFVFIAFTTIFLSWLSLTAIFLSFLSFLLSEFTFSASLATISSPHPKFHRHILLFLLYAAVSGYLSFRGVDSTLAYKGFAYGLFYASFYLYKKRWVLQFPIVQRSVFFSFKMGIRSAMERAFKLSVGAYLLSSMFWVVLQWNFNGESKLGNLFFQHIISYAACLSMFICWELTHNLHQILQTKRVIFAPPKGSAAAETNPSEPLLAVLEECSPTSLLKYLAHLDLCMVCDSNVDYWRRAAFFEETGETYRRVASVCLRPLEQLALELGQSIEGSSDGVAFQISDQLQPPMESRLNSKCYELMSNIQQYTWAAQAIASLTAHSHKEDRYGVAQLTGCNATVVTTLLSCLLAVETLKGKKSSLQPSQNLTGPAAIKWATLSSRRRDVSRTVRRRGTPLYSKAYIMADVLRTSIYCIVSAFHKEMLSNAKAGLLEKDWISGGKPPFGTRELLLQKLHLFLDFQAN